jgi:hypothetical protein
VYDANLSGWGQRMEYRSVVDIDAGTKIRTSNFIQQEQHVMGR